MANPTLSKSGVTTVTLTSGSTYPSGDVHIPNQFIGVPDSNQGIRTASLGPARRIIPVVFEQLNRNDRANMLAFFSNPLINWALNSFIYTDEDGVASTVKFLEPEFQMPEISDDNVSLTMNFTVL